MFCLQQPPPLYSLAPKPGFTRWCVRPKWVCVCLCVRFRSLLRRDTNSAFVDQRVRTPCVRIGINQHLVFNSFFRVMVWGHTYSRFNKLSCIIEINSLTAQLCSPYFAFIYSGDHHVLKRLILWGESVMCSLHGVQLVILRPASLVHIGNRLKIGHWSMMFCMPNILPTQF